MKQRIRMTQGEPVDLWSSPTNPATEEPDELADVRAEFATADADVDERSAVTHLKAALVLAASRKAVTEETYLAALRAVSSEEARRSEGEVAEHVKTAEVLSDAAESRLAARGIYWSTDGYERLYINEIAAISRESGLEYRGA
jgi:hypothetical protein